MYTHTSIPGSDQLVMMKMQARAHYYKYNPTAQHTHPHGLAKNWQSDGKGYFFGFVLRFSFELFELFQEGPLIPCLPLIIK